MGVLPEWFQLSKYDASKKFTPIEWYRAFRDRSELVSQAEAYFNNGLVINCIDDLPGPAKPVAVMNFLNSLDDPLSFSVYSEEVSPGMYEMPAIESLKSIDVHAFGQRLSDERGYHVDLGINATNDGGVYDICAGFEADELFEEYVSRNAKETLREGFVLRSKADVMKLHYRRFANRNFITIDRRLPKATLVEAFKKFLDDHEFENTLKTPSFKSSLSKVFGYKVLPILDLHAWYLLTGYDYKKADIFKYVGVSEDDFKRKYEPHAIKVVSDSFLADLAAYLNLNV